MNRVGVATLTGSSRVAAGSRPLLDVQGLAMRFGGVHALNGVTFALGRGEFLGLIGPNGAGKTSLLNAICRVYPPSGGSIWFDGVDLLALKAHRIIARGIARTYQNLALCPTMSVLRNVMLGGIWLFGTHAFAEWLRLPSARARARQVTDGARAALDTTGLADLADVPVSALPHSIRRKVELARALCARPKLLLLDEPASGLSDPEIADLLSLLRRLRETEDLTIVVIEHRMDVVMALSDRIIVLDDGRVIADGSPSVVTTAPEVLEAYLGRPQ
jgi:branched-chain amino acid transport system ATP-binding protein